MATDREIDLIVKANVGQALQPLAEVATRINAIVTALQHQTEAAQTGGTSVNEFAKSLRNLDDVGRELLRTRAALDNFAKQGSRVDARENVVEARRQARDTLEASLPAEGQRTAAQEAALTRLNRSLERSVTLTQNANIALAKQAEELVRIGVLTDSLGAREQRLAIDRAHAEVTAGLARVAAAQASSPDTNRIAALLREADVRARAEKEAAKLTADAISVGAAEEEAARKAALARALAPTRFLLAEREREAAERVRAERAAGKAEADAIAAATAEREAAEKSGLARAISPARFLLAEREREAAERVRAERTAGRAEADAIAAATAEREAAEKAGLTRALSPARSIIAAKKLEAEELAVAIKAAGKAEADAIAAATAEREAAEKAGLTRALSPARSILADKKAEADAEAAAANARVRYLREVATLQERAEADRVRNAERELADEAKLEQARRRSILGVVGRAGALRQQDDSSQQAQFDRDTEAQQKRLRDAERSGITRTFEEDAARKAAADAALDALHAEAAEENRLFDRRKAHLADLATELRRTHEANLDALHREAAEENRLHDIRRKALREEAEAENALRDRATEVAAAQARVAAGRAAAVAAPVVGPTASGQVAGLLSGLDRTSVGAVTDVKAATDELVVTLGKAGLTAQSFNQAMDQVFATQRRIAGDASLIDAFRAQEAAVRAATKADHDAVTELNRVAAARKAGTVTSGELSHAETASINTAASLRREIAQHKALSDQLKARGLDTARLDAETAKLVETTRRLAAAQQGASQGGSKLFGLDSFQFQNLQFQVNDVVTQLSLGQGVLRTFEAQAGQIFQIFQLTTSQMKTFAAVAIPAAAAIVLLVETFSRLKDTVDATRGFAGAIAGTVDAEQQSSVALLNTARNLENLGIAFADARKATILFQKEGLSTSEIDKFATAARNLSLGLKVDFLKTAEQLATIPKAGVEDLQKLLASFGILSVELDNFIVKAEREGQLDLARAAVRDAIIARAEQARTAGIGPLDDAIIRLTNAWHRFLDALGENEELDKLIAKLERALDLAAKLVKATQDALKDRSRETPNTVEVEFNRARTDQINNRVTTLKKQLEDLRRQIKEVDEATILSKNTSTRESVLQQLYDQANALNEKLKDALVAQEKLVAMGGSIPTPNAVLTQPTSFGPPGSRGNLVPGAAELIDNTAATLGLGKDIANFATRIAQIESGGNQTRNGRTLTSDAGALGMFQVRPDADLAGALPGASRTGRTITGGPAAGFYDLHDPVQNVKAGLAELARLFQVYNGDLSKVAAGYIGLGTSAKAVAARADYLMKLGLADRGIGEAQRPFTPPSAGIGRVTPEQEQAANNRLDELLRRAAALRVDPLLKGDSREARDRDAELVRQRDEDRRRAAQDRLKEFGGANLSPLATQRLDDERARDEKEFAEKRVKQAHDAEKANLDIIDAIRRELDSLDKTNPEAMRRAVADKFAKKFRDLDDSVQKGADAAQVGGLKKELVLAQAKETEQATLDANKAITETIVKARDESVAVIAQQLKHNAITLDEAFAQLQKVTAAFGPRIKAAQAVAEADLARQPQTPKIEEARARNAKLQAGSEDAAKAIDQEAFAKINTLISARTILEKSLNEQVALGRLTRREGDEAIAKAFREQNPEIAKQIDAFEKVINQQHELKQIGPEAWEQFRAAIQRARVEMEFQTDLQKKLRLGFEQSIVNQGATFFNSAAEAVGKLIAGTEKLGDTVKAVGIAFAQFAAGVLKDLALIIIKEELLNAVKAAGGLSGIASSTGSFIAGLFKAGAAAAGAPAVHAGGIVGSTTMSRMVDPAVFIGARRLHGGGLVGLASDDVPTILQNGEEVLTKGDARHRNNMGGKQAAPMMPTIRQVLVMDPSQVSAALAGAHGEKVVLTHIKNNSGAVRGILNSR